MKLKERIIKIGKWIAGVISVLIILIAILFGLAQTDLGKRQLAVWLASGLSRDPDAQVKLGKINGLIPFNIRLDRLVVSDPDGEWLIVKDITLRWSPAALLRGHLRIFEFSAAAIQLERLPPKFREGEEIKLPRWPKAFRSLILEHLSVERLTLGKAIVGERAVLTIDGQMTGSDSMTGIDASFRAYRTDGPKAMAQVTVVIRGKPPVLELHGMVEEEKGGLLAAALGSDGPFAITLDGSGPIKAWKGRLTGNAGSIGALDAEIRLRAQENYTLAANGNLRVNPSLLPPVIESLLSDKNLFSLSLRFENKKTFIIDHLSLKTGHADFWLTGRFGMEDHNINGDFGFKIRDIASLGAVTDTRLTGRLAVQGSLFGSLQNPRAAFSVSLDEGKVSEVQIDHLGGDLHLELLGPLSLPLPGVCVKGKGSASGLIYPGLQPLPLTSLDWEVDMDIPIKKAIFIRNLGLKGKNLALALSGHINLAKSLVLADVDIEMEDIRVIAGYWANSLKGATRLRARLKGDWKSRLLSADIKGRMTGFQLDSFPRISSIASEINYDGILELSKGKELTISNLRLATQTAELRADGSFNFSTRGIRGRWQLAMPQLAELSESLGYKLRGSLEIEGDVRGYPSALRFAVKTTGRDIIVENVGFQHIEAILSAEGPPLKPVGHLQMAIRQKDHALDVKSDFALQGNRLKLSDISLSTPGTKVAGNLSLDLRRMMAEGSLQGRSEDLSLLSHLLGEDVSGKAMFKARFAPDKVGQNVVVHFNGRELKTRFGQSGEVKLSASLMDVLNVPKGTAEVKIKAFQRDGLILETMEADAVSDGQRVTFKAHANGRSGEAFQVEGQGNLDLLQKLSLSPPAFSLSPDARIKGQLAAKINLALIQMLLQMEDQSIEGYVTVDLGLAGTTDSPEITGFARIEKAAYKNVRRGTILKDIHVLMKAKGCRMVLEEARATDGEDGIISAEGWLDLLFTKESPFQLDVNLDKATLLRQDNLTTSMGGHITLSGSLNDVVSRGRLVVGTAEIRIPDRLTPKITELEVVEINLPKNEMQRQKLTPVSTAHRLSLNLEVELPGRVFVRGRGLDSEWKGTLHIKGSLQNPVITGDMSVVRGNINLFGKRFALIKGKLAFNGTVPSSISLDVTAENRRTDMITRVHISGDLSSPRVTLESDPPLPSDEVLSHLLFRRSATRITPLQAFQLARAIKA
ncbi:MAG: translocation/assembly module TamB domain-containing protein, partial [Desulfobacteria bacterium]